MHLQEMLHTDAHTEGWTMDRLWYEIDIQLDCSQWYTIANIRFFTFDLDLGVMVTQNNAQYPPHHVTYAPMKFDVAASKGSGDAFTRKHII